MALPNRNPVQQPGIGLVSAQPNVTTLQPRPPATRMDVEAHKAANPGLFGMSSEEVAQHKVDHPAVYGGGIEYKNGSAEFTPPVATPITTPAPLPAPAVNASNPSSNPQLTTLTPPEQSQMQDWAIHNKIPSDNSANSDYDMNGYFKKNVLKGAPLADMAKGSSSGVSANDGQMHFTDEFKTTNHPTQSAESKYAPAGAPNWNSQDQLVKPNGQVVIDERANADPNRGMISDINSPVVRQDAQAAAAAAPLKQELPTLPANPQEKTWENTPASELIANTPGNIAKRGVVGSIWHGAAEAANEGQKFAGNSARGIINTLNKGAFGTDSPFPMLEKSDGALNSWLTPRASDPAATPVPATTASAPAPAPAPAGAPAQTYAPTTANFTYDLGRGNSIGDGKERSAASVERMRQLVKDGTKAPVQGSADPTATQAGLPQPVSANQSRADRRLQDAAVVNNRMDAAKAQSAQAQASQPVQQALPMQQSSHGDEYSSQIAELMDAMPENSQGDSLGTMVAKKHNRTNLMAKIAAVQGLRKDQLAQDHLDQTAQREQNHYASEDRRYALGDQRAAQAQANADRTNDRLVSNSEYQMKQDGLSQAHTAQKEATAAAIQETASRRAGEDHSDKAIEAMIKEKYPNESAQKLAKFKTWQTGARDVIAEAGYNPNYHEMETPDITAVYDAFQKADQASKSNDSPYLPNFLENPLTSESAGQQAFSQHFIDRKLAAPKR